MGTVDPVEREEAARHLKVWAGWLGTTADTLHGVIAAVRRLPQPANTAIIAIRPGTEEDRVEPRDAGNIVVPSWYPTIVVRVHPHGVDRFMGPRSRPAETRGAMGYGVACSPAEGLVALVTALDTFADDLDLRASRRARVRYTSVHSKERDERERDTEVADARKAAAGLRVIAESLRAGTFTPGAPVWIGPVSP